MSKPEDQNELKAFEARLAALVPRDDRLDRERLAFLAGQASMANTAARPSKILGVRLDSRAWPAAFAAMRAVAATLLLVLVTRPEAPSAYSFAHENKLRQDDVPSASPSSGNRTVLTTQDVRYGDLEKHLAKLEAERRVADMALPMSGPPVPVYTPSAWQRVFKDSNSSQPMPGKSSSISQEQGVNT